MAQILEEAGAPSEHEEVEEVEGGQLPAALAAEHLPAAAPAVGVATDAVEGEGLKADEQPAPPAAAPKAQSPHFALHEVTGGAQKIEPSYQVLALRGNATNMIAQSSQ